MYQIGDIVVHKVHGISEIIDIVKFSYGDDLFYKIVPNIDKKLKIYVPVKNEKDIIRSVISLKEADELITYIKGIDASVVNDSKSRRDEYARMLNTGNIKDLAFLTKKLLILRNEKIKNNRVIGIIDQDTFVKASNMLFDELSIVYSCPKEEIENMISLELV